MVGETWTIVLAACRLWRRPDLCDDPYSDTVSRSVRGTVPDNLPAALPDSLSAGLPKSLSGAGRWTVSNPGSSLPLPYNEPVGIQVRCCGLSG